MGLKHGYAAIGLRCVCNEATTGAHGTNSCKEKKKKLLVVTQKRPYTKSPLQSASSEVLFASVPNAEDIHILRSKGQPQISIQLLISE